QYEGQLQVYRPDSGYACLRCVWPAATEDGVVGNCAEAGVLGPVPGVLGSLQALQALKVLLDLEGQLAGELLLFDLTDLSIVRIRAPRCAECRAPGCARIHEIAREEARLELGFDSLADAQFAGFEIIDIRDPQEVAARPSGARHIPMNVLLADPGLLAGTAAPADAAAPSPAGPPYLLLCATGKRSLATARALQSRGIAVKSLAGG